MPSRLSKLFSSSKRETITDKHIEAARHLAEAFQLTAGRPSSGPPAYFPDGASFDAEHDIKPADITQGFNNLAVSPDNEAALPAISDSIAHLKLLECFYRLKQEICKSDGLFGINDRVVLGAHEQRTDQETARLLSKLAEKRWAVYVARAVDRFNSWSNLRFPSTGRPTIENINKLGSQGQLISRIDLRTDSTQNAYFPMLPGNINPFEMMQRMQSMLNDPQAFIDEARRNQTSRQNQPAQTATDSSGKGPGLSTDDLPPIDVLLVWHSFMLNPRAYMEDCIRKGLMQLWHQVMPLGAIANAIDSSTFVYTANDASVARFISLTERNWSNAEDETYKLLQCPFCETINQVVWTNIDESRLHDTSAPFEARVESMLSSGRGYCDQDFFTYCSSCGTKLTPEHLSVGKVHRDLVSLQRNQIPMPGTIFGMKGIPGILMNWGPNGMTVRHDEHARTILLNANGFFVHGLGLEIRDAIESGQLKTLSGVTNMIEYKIRDRKYVIKSRAAARTKNIRPERMAIRRLMSRYWNNPGNFPLDLVGAVLRQGTFIDKMHDINWLHSPALHHTVDRLTLKYSRFLNIIASSQRMAVPTLDVDLAWHTHQLRPRSYMVYTVTNVAQFLDHDDKVPETTLHDAFAWTSDEYQRRYGEVYAECTCWYCEAVRESHTPAPSRMFKAKRRQESEPSRDIDVNQHDPSNVHISSHSAVRPHDAALQQLSFEQSQRLERAFSAACSRAQQKGRPSPRREDFYWSHAYGHPVYIPAYGPFMAELLVTSSLYTVSPGCMATTAGASGNCCSGTCGGTVNTGGCVSSYSFKDGGVGGGGSSSSASASNSGGCSGGSGGCGGGGGGGCGGGGGG